MTLTPQFPGDVGSTREEKKNKTKKNKKNSLDAEKLKGFIQERPSRRLKVKRAKELELVVVDKRAKRKESRVLDSNGESGALGGLCPVRWEERGRQ